MQAATDLLGKGISTLLDAALQPPPPPPSVNPERARQLQQEAELARRAEQERHDRLLGSLKLSGAASSPVSTPVSQDNPLGLKLGPSVLEQPAPGLGPDGLAPRGTPFFGLGGNGTPGPGASEAAPSTRPGADRSAISQLNTAAGGGLRPLDFKRLPASIKQNAEFLKLNQQRNESIAQFEEFKAQIEALRTKLAAPGANIGSIESNIRVLEAKQQQQEVFIDFSNREMKRQWKVDVEEQ